MKQLKIFSVILIVCLTIFIFVSPAQIDVSAAELFSQTSAKAMCVIEATSGRVLAEKNSNEQMAMASTTKIVTALTVINNIKNLDEIIEIDSRAVGVEGSSIYLRRGEQMSIKDLLYGLMLRSGNDAAAALAYHTGGGLENFAKLMNETAKSCGAVNSNFVTPHGLDHDKHYTTAYDLALISANALNNPIFKEIVSTKLHVVNPTNVSEKRYMRNKNRLLSSLDGCCGVKTGFTKKAGRCLVSAIERDNATYVCVVLNCGPMFEDSATLLNNSHSLYRNRLIIDKNKEIFNEYILDDKAGKLYLYPEEDFSYPLSNSEVDDLVLKYNVKLDSAREGDAVGEIQVFLKKDLIKTIKLCTINKIDKLIDSKTLQISEILWEEKANEN